MVTKKNHNVRRKRFNKTRKRSTKYKKQLGGEYNKKYNDIPDEYKYYVVVVEELLKKHLPNKHKEFMKLIKLMKIENNDSHQYMEIYNEAKEIFYYSFKKKNAETAETFLKDIVKIVCKLPKKAQVETQEEATEIIREIAKKQFEAWINRSSCENNLPKPEKTGYSRRRGYRRQVGGGQQQQIREGQELAGQALMGAFVTYSIAFLVALVNQMRRNPPRDTGEP
jgi:hypothetical protein